MSQLTEGVKKYEEIKAILDIKLDKIMEIREKVSEINDNSSKNVTIFYQAFAKNSESLKLLFEVLHFKNRIDKETLIEQDRILHEEINEISKKDLKYCEVELSQMPRLLELITGSKYEFVALPIKEM